MRLTTDVSPATLLAALALVAIAIPKWGTRPRRTCGS